MTRFFKCLGIFLLLSFVSRSQTGYDIKISFKDCPDSTVYLARYFFDQLPIVDSCKKIRNGKIQFKGNAPLEKGVYFLANQARSSFYFQFLVDDKQTLNFSIGGGGDLSTLKALDDKQNEQFISYVQFMTARNREMQDVMKSNAGKSDSARIVREKSALVQREISRYDSVFMIRNKGSFVHDLMNLKNEKYPKDVPLAKNGRPDSIYQYHYYKSHFFEGVNFADNRLIYTPFFADRIKRYFDKIAFQHPDSIIKEIDAVLSRAVPGSTMFNTLVGHFASKYEQNKTMSFDQYGHCNTFEKVFIHIADKYIITGKTDGYYSAEVIAKIRERVDILRNLLPGVKVADLYMIDTTYARPVLRMGFDTARSSAGATFLYYKNVKTLETMYRRLYDLQAKYTVLVFWAADCGHCQTEIPKLHEAVSKLRKEADVKVYAVQTKDELFETWRKFLVEKKLNEFVHVFDPIHINSLTLKDRFDIVATPVIYLLDKDKNIIAKKLGAEQVVEIVQRLETIDKTSHN